jgi:hypothetical protein
VSAETRDGKWQKLWPRLAVSVRNSERESGETAVWLAGRVAGLAGGKWEKLDDLPEELRGELRGEILELLQMTGLTVSAE